MATTDMATRNGEGAAMLERVVVGGDLSKLEPKERLLYYNKLCDSLGLNPLTRPFQYLTLSNRLVLYATKDATEQLRKANGVSITKLESERDDDTYTVRAYGKDKAGREDVATGVVSVGNIRGEALANAKMKAETKAKRRLTLSICGLGMLDESEVDDVVIGGRVEVDHDTGEVKTDLKHDALAATEPGPEPGSPDPDKDILLGRVQAGFDVLGLTRAQADELWFGFCGRSIEPLSAQAAIDDLRKLHQHLSAKYKESGKSSKSGAAPQAETK